MNRAHSRLVAILVLGLAVGCGGHVRPNSKSSTSGASTTVNRLPAPRAEHTAIELPSGDIFVAGGVDVMGMPLASTVIISSTGATAGPNMASPRVGHSVSYDATTGTVIIAGGLSDLTAGTVLDSTEVFDPAAGTITAGPTLAAARARHAAVVYPGASGVEILFAGGVDATGAPMDSAEVLDVAAGTSSALANTLSVAQWDMVGSLVDTGNVLLVAGKTASGPAAAQLFNPTAGTFTALGSAPSVSDAAVASVTPQLLLVAGGEDGTGLLDTGTAVTSGGASIPTGSTLAAARKDLSASRLSDGSIAVIGGQAGAGVSAAVEVYTGSPATFVAAPDMLVARYGHTATARAGSDSVMVIGGRDSTGVPTDSIETLDLSAVVAGAPTLPVVPPPPGSIVTYPYTENFDGGLGAWTQSTADDFDWTANTGTTPSLDTGPTADHTGGGQYMYTESSTPNSNAMAILEGPTFASFQVLEVRFWYHMLGDDAYGNPMGTMSLDVSTDQGASWTNDVWTKTGTQSTTWNLGIVDLSAYAGQAVTIRFRGVTVSYGSDMAIDDVQVDDQLGPAPPPPPTPGGVVPFPYAENFDAGMGNWTQSTADDFDWTLNSGTTPSVDTGPTADHTSGNGQYIYTESSAANYPTKTAIIDGPSFQNFSSLELRFWYHMRCDATTYLMGSLDLDVSTDGGTTWTQGVWNRSGNQGAAWNEAIVDLSAYAGQTVQLRFRVITDGFNSDVAIDDITVTGTP